MIKLLMYGNNWRIEIGDEIWEFPTLEDMKINLDKILDIKDKFGRLKFKEGEKLK
jgi:hypothetical protein